MGYSKLLRKVAERVLRDITIIIFRRFSVSSSLKLLRQQHLENHKLTGIQFKLHRHRSIQSPSSPAEQGAENDVEGVPESVREVIPENNREGMSRRVSEGVPLNDNDSDSDNDNPSWDSATYRIISFLSSRINPNVLHSITLFDCRLVV